MGTFYIAEGNTSPALQSSLKDASGAAVNLTGNGGVVLDVWDASGAKLVDAQPATIVGAPSEGVVSYQFSAAETAEGGIYLARWTVTFADASIESYPNEGFDQVQISGAPDDYQITIGEVTDGFTTAKSNLEIQGAIAVVNQADACLAANQVSVELGRYLKVLGARHLLEAAERGGAITQERAVSGASRSYAQRVGGETGSLQTLRTVDASGCVMGVLTKNGRIQLRSVGRRSPGAS